MPCRKARIRCRYFGEAVLSRSFTRLIAELFAADTLPVNQVFHCAVRDCACSACLLTLMNNQEHNVGQEGLLGNDRDRCTVLSSHNACHTGLDSAIHIGRGSFQALLLSISRIRLPKYCSLIDSALDTDENRSHGISHQESWLSMPNGRREGQGEDSV